MIKRSLDFEKSYLIKRKKKRRKMEKKANKEIYKVGAY